MNKRKIMHGNCILNPYVSVKIRGKDMCIVQLFVTKYTPTQMIRMPVILVIDRFS